MTIHIITDSSCDLPDALALEHNITIVPLTIRFGTQEFVDREQLSPAEFWKRVTSEQELPKTAAPSPGSFETAFRKAIADGATGILCLTLSSKLSGTYQSATIAAQSVQNEIPINVLDTLSITTGLGSLAITAAQLAQTGLSLEELATTIAVRAQNTHVYATLDTLDYLKRGGRIGGAQAFLGSLLSIKPVISIHDGEVQAEAKQRTRSRAIDFLVQKITSARQPESITICAGMATDVDQLADKIRAAIPDADIMQSVIGPVIGTYGGPGVLGVTFVASKPTQ